MLKNKIIVYGGTFNPVGKHHLKIIRWLLKLSPYRLLIIPTDNNYQKKDIISLAHRINMLKLATKRLKNVEILEYNKSNIKTIEYLDDIKKRYKREIYFAMGTDNLIYLHDWYKSEELLQNYSFIVFNRETSAKTIIEENQTLKKYEEKFIIYDDLNESNVSSSAIRLKIELKDYYKIGRYIDKKVFEYIKEMRLYDYGKKNL